MSGLYRTFKINYVPYFADGRGRDRYIAYNNAGFFHDFPKSLSPTNSYKTGTFFGTKIIKHYKSPSVKAPNFHYHSDGNGRDKYILVNGGGLYYDSKPLISYKLTDFLRKNDYQYHHTPSNRRVALSRDEIRYNQLLRSKEKELIKRLYINEKKKFMKRKKFNPNFWLSSDEIKKDYDDNINKSKTSSNFCTNGYNDLKKRNNKTKECFNSRYNYQNEFNNKNNVNNFSYSNMNSLKFKPKLVIDANNNNKLNVFERDINNSSYKTNNDFYNDIDKIKKYQVVKDKNKNLIKFKKPPYFHILNEQNFGNQNQ